MDKQRLSWVVMILAGTMVLGLWLLKKQAAQEEPKQSPAPASRPAATASAPTTASAPAVPSTAPATQPTTKGAATTTPAPAVRAPATADRAEWLHDSSGLGPQNKFVLGSKDPNSEYLVQVEFVRQGAAIYTVKLAKTFVTVDDKRLYESLGRSHARYEAARAADPKTYQGHYSVLNPVGGYRPYATRSITVAVTGSGIKPKTIYLDSLRWRCVSSTPVTQPAQGVEIRFEATLYRDRNHVKPASKADYKPALKLVKAFRVLKNDYSLEMHLSVENLSRTPLKVYVDQLGPTGVPLEELNQPRDDRFAAYGKLMAKDGNVQVLQKPQGEIEARSDGVYKVASGVRIGLGRSDEAEPVLWVGQANKFFASMVYLRPTVKERLPAATWQADFHFLAVSETPALTSRTFVTGIRIGGKRLKPEKYEHAPNLLLPPGKPKEMVFDIFAGPKIRDMFRNDKQPPSRPGLYKDLNYFGTINFRSCFCAWDALTEKMMQLLKLIATYVTFRNYGLAIMILVLLVRIVLHPLTKKGQVNMMKMQKLQPEMAKLRKKYADDKETLQKEMMKFYKTQGASPLLGCLPMFLQMPIWISLWGSLNAAVELRHAAFLPVWITDLAGPDALFSWETPLLLPLVGGMVGPLRSFNLLPLLMTAAMFLQMKFSPQMSQPAAAATPEQEKQQATQKRMMQIMMPVMMLLFFYNAASGLTLYIMTSTFAGVLEQHIMRKHIEAKEAVEAATTTTVKLPGKAARGSRPKKPKGPFFIKRG
ncbi:MAG TPA: membrane protein insertase YidC [Phycisphaerae bacterium]|nr:membrane protein insertase YidC [Phycisphaerae bacterium]